MSFSRWKKKNLKMVKELQQACGGLRSEFHSIIQSAFHAGNQFRIRESERVRAERDNNAHVVWNLTNFPGEDGPCEPGCKFCIAVAKQMDNLGCVEKYPNPIWWENNEELVKSQT